MTVAELIFRLRKLPADARLVDPDEDPDEYDLDVDIRNMGAGFDNVPRFSLRVGPIERE